MTPSQELFQFLNNDEEPLNKRIRLADNAFKSTEIPIQHKEAFLLNWIFIQIDNSPNNNLFPIIHQWFSSEQFKEIIQNDISTDDIANIIELFLKCLKNVQVLDSLPKNQVLDSILLLCDNKVFQQYFKYHLNIYCDLISTGIQKIECPKQLLEFLKSPCLFPKGFLVEDQFCKHFVNSIVPVLLEKNILFKEDNVFNEVSRILQKCIFQGNIKKFECFVSVYFEGNAESEDCVIPKTVFKYISTYRSLNEDLVTYTYKLFFHSFCKSYNNSSLTYKYFVLLLVSIGLEIAEVFKIQKKVKKRHDITLEKSLEIIWTLLDVIGDKNNNECAISDISFTDFLRNLLKSVIFLQIPCPATFEIILKCIEINPLVIESIINQLVPFILLASNGCQEKSYESVVIAIFEVFAKLHRLENFIAKVIPALKSVLVEGNEVKVPSKEIYAFRGTIDTKSINEPLEVKNIFTFNILQYFTKCINGLASWQVINLMKTLVFHLKTSVKDYTDENEQGYEKLLFLEILGTLLSSLLKSVKMADHTVPENVVQKFVKGLDDLKNDVLKPFGLALLQKEHNHVSMRTFLNICHIWAEIYMTLTYYSNNNEVKMMTVLENALSATNLRYLHSYLDVKQWQLITQRITNFGEHPCQKLLQKLYIQKLRGMLLFEENLGDDIINNVVRTLQNHLENTWEDILLDKFAVNFILPKMDCASLKFLAEHLIERDDLYNQHHIGNSVTVTNAVIYITMLKITKLFKQKRKHDEELKKTLSTNIFDLLPEELFLTTESFDLSETIDYIKNLYKARENVNSIIESKQEKLVKCLLVFKKFPIIFGSINIQQATLLYLFALYGDITHCSDETKTECEDLIIGILQSCKFQVMDIFDIDVLFTDLIERFRRYMHLVELLFDNVFKNEESIKQLDPFICCLIKHLNNEKYLNCSILLINVINKNKKSKINQTTKEIANVYKDKLFVKMAKLVCKSKQLVEPFAICLKYYLSIDKDKEILENLLNVLDNYIEYALENISNENKKGCMILFTTVLHNKQKIKNVNEDFVLKVWTACKKVDIASHTEEYSHLVKLIVTLIPNPEFHILVTDLLSFTEKSIEEKNGLLLSRQLKTWESILTCNVNPIKMRAWQEALETVIYQLLDFLKSCHYDEQLFKDIIHFEESIIQMQHFILSSPLIDMFINTTSILNIHESENFTNMFDSSISILEKLLKYRNAMIMDRLPPFLQQFRILLKSLCAKSNAELSESSSYWSRVSDSAHKMEKLTKNIVASKKDMGRIAVFLIADILERYEQVNLYPNVKLHLNNCIYSLISICDHHSVAYLMRVLSSASTEMFKILYEHYKKYYMFTGKV